MRKCIHCLQKTERITWDHVIPVSWYPDGAIPKDIRKWKAPSCDPCNHHFGKIEEQLGVRLILCIDPSDSLLGSMSKRLKRAIIPERGTTERDRRARARFRNKILNELALVDTTSHGIFPGFGPYPDEWRNGKAVGIKIPGKLIRSFAEKVLRGVYYEIDKRYVEDGYLVKVAFLEDGDGERVISSFSNWEKRFELGPALNVQWARAQSDPASVLCKLLIWKKLSIYGYIINEEIING